MNIIKKFWGVWDVRGDLVAVSRDLVPRLYSLLLVHVASDKSDSTFPIVYH